MNKDDLKILDGIRKEERKKEDIEDVKDRYFIYTVIVSITFFIIGLASAYAYFLGDVNATCHLLDESMSEYNVTWVIHNETNMTLLRERAQSQKFICNVSSNLTCSEQRKAFVLGDYLSNASTISGYEGYQN